MTTKTKNAAIRSAGRIDLQTICHLISEDTGIAYPTLNAASKHIFRTIRTILEGQQEVEVADFGRFAFKHRKSKITSNINGGPDTYTPANSKIVFRPEVSWESWQRIHSSDIPDELPEGTVLGSRLGKSHHVRSEYPHLAADNNNPFYTDFLVERAKRRMEKENTHKQLVNNGTSQT